MYSTTGGAGSRTVDPGSSVVGRGDGLALRGHLATSRDFLAITTWRGDATGIEWVEASAQVGPATEGCPAQSSRPTQILGDAVS